MTTPQVVETSVTVNNNSSIQDYAYPDNQTQPTLEMTPGFNETFHSIDHFLWKLCIFRFLYSQLESFMKDPVT